ncbi:LysR family transcriptional regulator [Halarcobacter ebronensis]|uniref:LysR family transcriptional regulator n=1 Tax=Halarcobacter ebronensis TaxID=1462615 RepID=A0A4Q0Y934_9BACT|nr:LysR family transcriptional regulator [Halarcobacter ebronensis]RXJ66483.1 LysR family transcriptional regulator [Halarcobacter ebronensis]
MDSNLLKVFVAVAQKQSISLGALELGFAQSNVTSRIKQLEKNIGHKLFHRVPKGVKLTLEGEKLYPLAIEVVKKMENIIFEMKSLQEQSLLRIGSTESNAAIRLSSFLVETHKKFPNMQLELITGTTEHITTLLLEYKIDIAFVSGRPKDDSIEILNEFSEKIVLLEPKIGKVPDVILTFKKGCTYNEYLHNHYSKDGICTHKNFEFGSLETILSCVEAGMGRALLPLKVVEKLGFKDTLKIIEIEKLSNIPTTLICRKDNPPKVRKYLNNLTFK